METNALDLVEVMETVMARANTNKGVVSTALSGSAENLTIGQSTMTADEVSALVTEEEAKALGFESAAAFGESFTNATKSFATDWQTAMGEYVTSVST
jgi:transaldolase